MRNQELARLPQWHATWLALIVPLLGISLAAWIWSETESTTSPPSCGSGGSGCDIPIRWSVALCGTETYGFKPGKAPEER